jgi:hypothetical protein
MATEYIVGSSLIISVIDDRSLSQSTTQCAVSKQVLIVEQVWRLGGRDPKICVLKL